MGRVCSARLHGIPPVAASAHEADTATDSSGDDDMHHIFTRAGRFMRRDDGQDLLEYGLLAALIAITAVAAVGSVGTTMNRVLWQLIAQNV